MATTIKLKNSVTTTNAPSSLEQGEVAINITDKKVWVGNAATTPIQLLGAGGSATFGALTCTSLTNSGLTSGRVTYAGTGGLLQDDADFTFNGTTVTMANDASISGLTVGKGANAVSQNTAVGFQALNSGSLSGNFNVALGYQALLANTTGAFNHGLGRLSLTANTTGAQNVAVGNASLSKNTTGSFNIGIGSATLVENLTTSNNVAIGQNSMNKNVADNNTAVGAFTLDANTTGTENSAFGNFSLTNSTTGSYNTAIGVSALLGNTTASNNTAVGYQAGYSNTTGTHNSFFGLTAGYNITTGGFNTFLGQGSGENITTGTKNSILGRYNGNQGGLDIRTASNNIVLSDGDGNPRGIFDGSGNLLVAKTTTSGTTIGHHLLANGIYSAAMAASTNTASTLDIYSTGAGAYRFYVTLDGKIYCTSTTIAAISDQRLKENVRDLDVGLNAIMAVKPRRFDWKDGKGQDKKNAVGFIAQEFETVFPDSVATSKAGEDGIEYKTVCHEELIPAMVKAIQELKAEVDSLKAQLNK